MISLELIIIVLSAAVLIFIAVVFYFFSIAFVRMKEKNLEDLDHIENRILSDYRATVQNGIDFAKNYPHKWVETKSFDGLRLFGRYYDNNSHKTMILFHGYRSVPTRDFSCAIKMYTEFGFNVLLVDQRAHGKSEGKLITYGVKERKDVLSWVNFVNENYNPEKIALGGMSMGATTVLLACGLDLPKNVKCVVADCGFTSPVDIIKIVAKKSFSVNATFFLPILDFCCRIFGRFSIYNISTPKELQKSDLPVILIHGKEDGFVPCEMSKEAYDAIPERAELVLVDGADHGLAFLVETKTVYSRLEDFLNKNIL